MLLLVNDYILFRNLLKTHCLVKAAGRNDLYFLGTMYELLFTYLHSLFVAGHAYAWRAIIFGRRSFSFLKHSPRRSPNITQPGPDHP